jgi:hypothetical protein
VIVAIGFSAAGALTGALGILFGLLAYYRATAAVRECNALAKGSAEPRGAVDPRSPWDVAIVRYDALYEMSGQLSFSLALLNPAGDGVVLSSINGRAETRTYAKAVVAGKGVQELSPEETQAVRSAQLGLGPEVVAAKRSSATA